MLKNKIHDFALNTPSFKKIKFIANLLKITYYHIYKSHMIINVKLPNDNLYNT